MGLNLPNMTKQRASEISRNLASKTTAQMNRDRQVSMGIKYAIWVYIRQTGQNTAKLTGLRVAATVIKGGFPGRAVMRGFSPPLTAVHPERPDQHRRLLFNA